MFRLRVISFLVSRLRNGILELKALTLRLKTLIPWLKILALKFKTATQSRRYVSSHESYNGT